MQHKLHDLRVVSVERLISPKELKQRLPVTEEIAQTVFEARQTVRRIIHGEDRRLLCVVGPCSIHDPDAALEYAGRLQRLAAQVADELFVVMRVYFEKPRTTVGWKGLINDPRMDESYDVAYGLELGRHLLLEVNRLGLPAASEMLDPVTPQYLADLVAWAAIGARTVESQTHREMASGLSMPVGFKNTTDGNLQVAVNAVESSRRPHAFLGITQDGQTAVIRTSGNPDTHVVLRGGGGAPNYDPESIARCTALLARAGLEQRLMVDCSHGQTNKDYRRQPEVLEAVITQVCAGAESVLGFMLESNLEAGSQKPNRDRSALRYGVSVTDPCIDWPTTETHLIRAAQRLAHRRARGHACLEPLDRAQ